MDSNYSINSEGGIQRNRDIVGDLNFNIMATAIEKLPGQIDACFVRPMKGISIDIEKLCRRFNRNQNVVRRLKGDTKHLIALPKSFIK